MWLGRDTHLDLVLVQVDVGILGLSEPFPLAIDGGGGGGVVLVLVLGLLLGIREIGVDLIVVVRLVFAVRVLLFWRGEGGGGISWRSSWSIPTTTMRALT